MPCGDSITLTLTSGPTRLKLREETPVTVRATSGGMTTASVQAQVLENGTPVGLFPPTGEDGRATTMVSFVKVGIYQVAAKFGCETSDPVTLEISA